MTKPKSWKSLLSRFIESVDDAELRYGTLANLAHTGLESALRPLLKAEEPDLRLGAAAKCVTSPNGATSWPCAAA